MPREQPNRPAGNAGPSPQDGGLGALAYMLWRERGFMLAVFLVCFLALALLAVTVLQKSYTAHSNLLVRLDEAYAYNNALGQNPNGNSLGIDQIVKNEIALLSSESLKRRALDELGLRSVYPELADAYINAPAGEARERVLSQAILAMSRNLSVSAAPGAANIDVSFSHERPDIAARMVNTLVAEYLDYRPDILLGVDSERYQDQRDQLEARLAGANRALEDFLKANDLGDFAAYRDSLAERRSEVDQALFAARADLEQTRAELGALRTRLAQLPATSEQYYENDATGRLLDLYLQRVDLRSRYTADAVPVQELEEQISKLETFLADGGAEGAGQRRVGPNPLRQEAEAREMELTGRLAGLQQQVNELQSQRQELRDEQLRIQNLSPQYERLSADISARRATANQIAARQEEMRAERELASGSRDNVTVVEPASVPVVGDSLKKPALAGALFISGFVSLLAGLVRGLMRGGPGFDFRGWANLEPVQRTAAPAPARRPAPVRKPIRAPAYAYEEPEPAPAPPAAQRLPVLAVVARRPDAAPAYG